MCTGTESRGWPTAERWSIVSMLLLCAAGCTGSPAPGEERARADRESVGSVYRPGDAVPVLPTLSPDSALADFLRFSLFKNPRVEAAYYDWAAAIERTTVARSLPDPRLTFDIDITNMVESLMPGLMMDFPGPGKLQAAGAASVRESEASYFTFEREIVRTALAVKTAYYRLHFLDESLRVQRETVGLLEDLERLARAQNAAGASGLQDVLRAQIELEELRTRIANLEDSRLALAAEWKAALGLGTNDADPPLPARFQASPPAEAADVVAKAAFARNPALRRMEAEVRRAEALLVLADKAGVPDFSAGIEADVRSSPVMWRPSASMTLPVWRDRIAAEIAGAQAEKRAAEARLSTEQIELAADLATTLFMYRESLRDADLLSRELIPKGRQALEAARNEYAAARAGFLEVIDAWRRLFAFETALVDARTRREMALATLSHALAGELPAGAPALRDVTETRQEPKR